MSYRKDLDLRFKSAKAIAYNIKSAKFSFSPQTLDDILKLAWISAVTQTNLFAEESVKAILRNGFHHDFVLDIRRSFDAVQRSAISTADRRKMPSKEQVKEEMVDNVDEVIGELEVLGNVFEQEEEKNV